jgi:hypothetical protein
MIFSFLLLLSPSAFAYAPFGATARETVSIAVNVATLSCRPTEDEGYPKDLPVLTLRMVNPLTKSRFIYEEARQTSYDALHNKPCALLLKDALAKSQPNGGHLTVTAEIGANVEGPAPNSPDGSARVEVREHVEFPFLPGEITLVGYKSKVLFVSDDRVRAEDPRYPAYGETRAANVRVDLAKLNCHVRDLPQIGPRFRIVTVELPGALPNARLAHPLFELYREVPHDADEAAECAPIDALKKRGVISAPLSVVANGSNVQDESIEIFEDAKLSLPGLDALVSSSIERLPFSDVRTR